MCQPNKFTDKLILQLVRVKIILKLYPGLSNSKGKKMYTSLQKPLHFALEAQFETRHYQFTVQYPHELFHMQHTGLSLS